MGGKTHQMTLCKTGIIMVAGLNEFLPIPMPHVCYLFHQLLCTFSHTYSVAQQLYLQCCYYHMPGLWSTLISPSPSPSQSVLLPSHSIFLPQQDDGFAESLQLAGQHPLKQTRTLQLQCVFINFMCLLAGCTIVLHKEYFSCCIWPASFKITYKALACTEHYGDVPLCSLKMNTFTLIYGDV